MTVATHDLDRRLAAVKAASRVLATTDGALRRSALLAVAARLEDGASAVLEANALDLADGRGRGIPAGLADRLALTPERTSALAASVRAIADLPDPLGEVVRGSTLPNGLRLAEVRVPFGVVGVVYEARPNVTVDIAALALASGNAAVLRGGSAARRSNAALVALIGDALEDVGLPRDAVHTIDDLGRDGAGLLMRARGLVDVLIPRGGAELIRRVVAESTVPVIETGAGVVHVYLDATADPRDAVAIVHDAKTTRPSVCNAVETVLVHADAASELVPAVAADLAAAGVAMRGDERVRGLVAGIPPVGDEDFATEHMALELSLAVVDSLDDALAHIRRFSTGHTEAIVTRDTAAADRFLAEVDSAVVMVNASTRFTDGGEFGFGAEVGISTQKLHARGPMGLPELTSTKWLVRGDGQVRGR